ncbi:MAG TPA: hypothetical protein DIW36_04565 [Ruminococcaceae bacterium]|nr:hypothetical protein [Oscillospiraceae bacterium]
MSKYKPLWDYVKTQDADFVLTFDQIEEILGFSIDHSFLTYKKELLEYGRQVGKISMKNRTVSFIKPQLPIDLQ